MLEQVVNYFYQRGRLRGIGQFLTYVAAYWCVSGAAGYLITVLPAALQRRPAQMLAEVMPDLPMWLVPEHPVSFVFVIAVGVFGFFLSLKGKQLDRFLNA